MSFSTPQVESKIKFSPLPQDVEQGQDEINIEDKERKTVMIEIEPQEEPSFRQVIVTVLQIAFVVMLFLGLVLRSEPDRPTSNPIAPRFFINSIHVPQFKISNNELSSTWDVTLAIYNDMNSSSINITRFDAAMSYKENETLAVITPKVSLLGPDDMKRVSFKLSTTGWEKDQPIVDDNVVQVIAEDIQRGFTRLGLQMRIVGEVDSGDGRVADFVMHASCNDLAFQVKGEGAMMMDLKPRKCEGPFEWKLRFSL